jgi:hypothetical protein
MSADKRRKGGWLQAIVADPWRKLLAIVLAVLAWSFVDSRINQTIERSVPLQTIGDKTERGQAVNRLAVVLPDTRVKGQRFLDGERQIQEVKVVISGPRFKVAAWEDRTLDLQVTKFVDLDWTKYSSIEFTSADLPRDLRVFQDLQIEMRPPRIRLEVERISEREFPLTAGAVEITEGPLANRLRRDTIEFVPKIAVVRGPDRALDALATNPATKFRVTLPAGGNQLQVSGTVELIDTSGGLFLAQSPVLTMQLLPQTTKFDLDVPVLLDDLALPPELRGAYRAEQKVYRVRIAAGGDLRTRLVNMGESSDTTRVAEWAAANLRLWVHVPRAETGAAYPLEMDRSARLVWASRAGEIVDRNECLLDPPLVVKLRRQ